MANEMDRPVDKLPTDHVPEGSPPELDPHKLGGQILAVLKNRIERAKKAQEKWVKNGLALRDFMDGDQWAADLKAIITVENGWVRKTVNKMKALRTGIISQVAFQSPKTVALPLRRTPSYIGQANVASTLINHSITESNFGTHQRKAALDALAFGAGFLQFTTDPERGGIAGVLHRCAEDVLIDPDATCPEDAKWVAWRSHVNIWAARHEYEQPSMVSDQAHAAEAGEKTEGIAPAPEDETVEVWEVWCRADAINFMDANTNSARNKVVDALPDDAPAALKYMTEEGNRVFHVSLRHGEILSDKPWPFILDHDMLPIWPVYLEESTNKVLPESPLKPAMGLQRALNTIFTFLTTQAYTTARIKYAVEKTIAQDEKAMKGLKSAEVGTGIGVDGGGMTGITPINMGQLNIAMIQLLKETNAFFDQITGYNEMFGGMQGARSAAEAVIREDRAQTNTSTMRQAFETGLKRIIRSMWQVSMSTLKAAKVANIVGREEMGYVNPETGEVDDDDAKNTVPINWPYEDFKPADIRRENFIEYVINSTQRSNPQQEAQDLRGLIQDVIGLIGTYTQQGYRIAPVRMARKLNYIYSRVLQTMGIADYKQMEITPEDLSIDDRLMPRGPTEDQMLAKARQQIEGEQKQATEESQAANVDALAEAIAQQMGVPIEQAQTMLAGLTPEMMTALVQEIESQGTMPGGPMPQPAPGPTGV